MTLRVAQMLPTLKVGGAEKLQVTLASAARNRPITVTVITLRAFDPGIVTTELRALGVELVSFPARHMRDQDRFRALTEHLREARYDVLQTHLTAANVVGALVGRVTGTPTIGTLHSIDSSPFYYQHRHRSLAAGHWALETIALRFGSSRVLAVGHGVADAHARRIGRERIDIIPNAVLPPASLTAQERVLIREELSSNPAGPLLISVGRLVAAKGLHDLIDAFSTVAARFPEARLAVVGHGNLRDDLETRIVERGLRDVIRLVGMRDDVPRLLAASDVYVSASHWEGLPIAILEAMIAGLPVVGTQVGDVPRVVVPGTGTVVPARQPDLLAAAMCDLLAEPVRMVESGYNAREHAIQHYSLDVWMDRLVALYQDVARTPARTR